MRIFAVWATGTEPCEIETAERPSYMSFGASGPEGTETAVIVWT
jgi:hypothetical protein